MFTQHPLTSEFFNIDDFIDENVTTLEGMFDQAKSFFPFDDEGWDIKTAIMVAASIYNDSTEVKFGTFVTEESEEGVKELANELVFLMNLFRLQGEGKIARHGTSWSLTEAGIEEGKKIAEAFETATTSGVTEIQEPGEATT